MKSIIQSKKECIVCLATVNLHEHHCLHGSGNRKQSEVYGLKVWLCASHHNMSDEGVHNKNTTLDTRLKVLAETKFIECYGSDIQGFIQIFGRNYL